MPAIKMNKFLGIAPKVSPELLPDGAGQIAHSVKLYSGDLIPYHRSSAAGSTGRNGEIKTLYALRDPDTSALVWLSWLTDVDIVVASDESDDDQRFYYTGDGVPKVSTFALATATGVPYPNNFYELGLPLPDDTPTAVATSFTPGTSVSFARDSGNTATIITSAAHGLRTGNIITVRGFTGTTPLTFNATNVRCTVLSTTSFSYYSPGANTGTTPNTDGIVDLAGNTVTRKYTYTWFTPWEEESIGSESSGEVFIKEGQTVTVSNLPTAAPAGSNFIRGIRLYRTLTAASGTEFYRLSTCWFPHHIATVARTSNVVTITCAEPHNLQVDERFKLSGCTLSTFNITGGIVTTVPDELTFTYAQSDADVVETAEAAGIIYHDVAELPANAARYWGNGADFTFVDDFDALNLTEILLTDDYDAPDENMIGIIEAQNNMLVGFFDNQLCFAQPGQPHAWPITFRRTFENTIVAIASVGGYIIVLTDKYAYRVSGSNPSTLSVARIDKAYPCLSKRSVINMGYGVLYSTHGGLALWSPSSGLTLVTAVLHHYDTWEEAVDPATVVATFYQDRYFATHSEGAFTFEKDDKVGGYFITLNQSFTAAWTDEDTGFLYYTPDETGRILMIDDATQPFMNGEWKSKVITTTDYMNLGAARVIADYAPIDADAEATAVYNAQVLADNVALWAVSHQLGTINGPTDYVNIVDVNSFGEIDTRTINGDGGMRTALATSESFPITFRLWVNKELIFTTELTSSEVFRLPTGYKADTFEIAVSGAARIRAVHLGETPYGLRKA